MQFEWDSAKARSNLRKHKISFDQAIAIFNDPDYYTLDDNRHEYGETRQNTIGAIDEIVILCVTHTLRSGRIRLISARPASRSERKIYHANRS